MATLISSFLGINSKTFKDVGVFDAVIGVDTRLFLDPFLLKKTKIPEFKDSRNKIEKYYTDIIRLLLASRIRGDRAWNEAFRRLTFKELHGVSIGYGVHSSNGSAIGPGLAKRLIDTAGEILEMGIKDPEIFELIGLFEEDFGADRLSDMTIVILREDFYNFTQRITETIGIKDLVEKEFSGKKFVLPKYPSGKDPLIFLPRKFLRDLPVALSWDGIDHVVATNRELRERLNKLIGSAWKNKITKRELRKFILGNAENIRKLISAYKNAQPAYYDFENDPASEVIWYELGKRFADRYPINLYQQVISIDDLKNVVEKIIGQFKKNIEVNALKEHLYVKKGLVLKPRHERFAQLLFYSTADSYCAANNLDISREPNAGSGPVDFKLSRGYSERILVEIKLSSNKALIRGFKKQLPTYQQSEKSRHNFYLVLRVTRSEAQIKRLIKIRDALVKEGKRVPEIVVIDAGIRPSASKRRL